MAGELRTEYEQARPWLHAARQNWWMDQATPQELGAAWQVATEWAAHGDLYADRTLDHLRDQIRARHAVEIPHHTLTGADLVAILANPRPDAAAPSGGPAVYRYTVTDDLAPGSPVTGYTSAAAGEDPELLLARVLTDHARAAGRPAAGFRAELSYSDADRAPGALAVALDGAGAETRLANEQQQRLLQHAVLLREHLTPERFRTLEPAEAGQWWATVTSWTEGPARRETLEFLAGRMDEAYGFRPDEGETAEQVAERAHRATDGRARVDARPPRPEHPPTFTVETAGSGVEALLTGLDEKIRAAVREEIRALVPPGSAADSALRAYVDSGSLGVREEPREAAGGPAEASALPRGGEPAGRRMTADERRAAVAGAAVVPVLRSPDTRVVRTPTLLPAPSEIPLGR